MKLEKEEPDELYILHFSLSAFNPSFPEEARFLLLCGKRQEDCPEV